jgi:hypothetical protein
MPSRRRRLVPSSRRSGPRAIWLPGPGMISASSGEAHGACDTIGDDERPARATALFTCQPKERLGRARWWRPLQSRSRLPPRSADDVSKSCLARISCLEVWAGQGANRPPVSYGYGESFKKCLGNR